MKIAILNDTHAGVRGDMLEMAKYQGRFYEEVFFPYLDENNIGHILHLGDYFDRRKYVNFASLKSNKEHFIQPMLDRGITMDLIIGNHDTYYKNTNEINSMEELVGSDRFKIYTGPEVVEFDDTPILFIPWINSNNYEVSMEALSLIHI